MMTYPGDVYIGIDPDVHKSGVAFYIPSKKQIVEHMAIPFWELVEVLRNYAEEGIAKVFIEAGWKNKKHNYHYSANQSKEAGERIANNVGRNHQVGRLLADLCDDLNIDYMLVVPKTAKTPPALFKKLTGLTISNPDVIDACMLVWGR